MRYGLLTTPDGYETDLALVVAPYFDTKFVTKLVKKLAPNRIRLVIDDGVRNEELENLRKCCGKHADVKIVLGAAAGLVHLKGYYLEFVKAKGRSRRKRRFLFGSANATEAAFGGIRNAELFASVDLYVEEDKALLEYFATLLAAIENGIGTVTGATFGPMRNSPTLLLPSFKVASPGPAPGFDAWLQRGLLAAKYRDAQQFLMVSITLKKRLPQDSVAGTFATRGLIGKGSRNIVRFAYVGNVSPDDIEDTEDTAVPQWKARYCNWTHLGDWLSDDCYSSLGNQMTTNTAPARQAKIEDFLNHGKKNAWKEEKKNAFLSALEGVWKDLSETDIDPNDYLKGGARGIDREQYGERFEKKLVADFRLAQDRDFRERYVNGYEFPKVPRFRQDTASWDSFTRSWCESVSVEAKKRSPRSFLTRVIAAVAEKFEVTLSELEPDEIRVWLRKSWGQALMADGIKTTVGSVVENYFHADELSIESLGLQ